MLSDYAIVYRSDTFALELLAGNAYPFVAPKVYRMVKRVAVLQFGNAVYARYHYAPSIESEGRPLA